MSVRQLGFGQLGTIGPGRPAAGTEWCDEKRVGDGGPEVVRAGVVRGFPNGQESPQLQISQTLLLTTLPDFQHRQFGGMLDISQSHWGGSESFINPHDL